MNKHTTHVLIPAILKTPALREQEDDVDFIFQLAYRALALEAEQAASGSQRIKIGGLLDRLVGLDARI